MNYLPAPEGPTISPKLPAWAGSGGAGTPESLAFRSGAALTILESLISEPEHAVPLRLLANRLALKAATNTSRLEGRMTRESDIRDAFHLTPDGRARGPDGDLLAFWREGATLRLRGRAWQSGLRDLVGPAMSGDVDEWIEAGCACARTYGPLLGCVSVLRAVLREDDRAERVACLLSDIVLARALNWERMLPVSAHGLTKTKLRLLVSDEKGAELNVQASMIASVQEAIVLARDLARRATTLEAIAPKLRAKGSEAAVALFLTEDAVAPSGMLSPRIRGTTIAMTDRAARRFCDRLVELGVARELTGRPSFRLYGITP